MKKTFNLFGKEIYSIETRSTEIPLGDLASPSQNLINALGNAVGSVNVTMSTAITLSAVWRAINVISSTLAGLPLKHYQNTDKGREHVRDSYVQQILKNPSDLMTGYIFRESLMAQSVGYGNGYAYIKRNGRGRAEELVLVHNNKVFPIKYQGRMYYRIQIDNEYKTVNGSDVIHVPGLSYDGLVGFSPITIARESFAESLASQKFSNKFYENGATIGGVLETPGELSDNAYKRLKESWHNEYHGQENQGKTAILEGGVKYSKIGIAPEEAQFLQTRQFQVTEIARWFGVPPHMLMELQQSTNNNIEHQGMEFVTYTLLPWANRFEEEITRKLIATTDQQNQYVEHEFNGLLRADSKSRGEYYKSMFGVASLTPNQILELENLPKYPDGDKHFVQGAYVPVDKIDSFYEGKTPKQPNNNEEDK